VLDEAATMTAANKRAAEEATMKRATKERAVEEAVAKAAAAEEVADKTTDEAAGVAGGSPSPGQAPSYLGGANSICMDPNCLLNIICKL
jgi:ABC-type phosphate transport system ATPase subunit